MDLHLISHALCPYVQRAAIALAEQGLAFRRTDVDLAAKPDWFLAISPLGKTPVLVADGRPIFESAVILEFLEEVGPKRLHPADPYERARHRGWIELASAALAEIAGLYGATEASAFEKRRRSLRGHALRLEDALDAEGPWFAGRRFGLVDAAFGPVFRYFDAFERLGAGEALDGLPRVARWRAALAERMSVRQAVAADYPARLALFLEGRPSLLGAQARAAAGLAEAPAA